MAARTSELDDYLDRFERHLPATIASVLKRARQPNLIWLRIPLAVLLIAGGFLAFLPLLGIWMIPLGLVLLAQDLIWLQPPIVAVFKWIERLWDRWRRR